MCQLRVSFLALARARPGHARALIHPPTDAPLQITRLDFVIVSKTSAQSILITQTTSLNRCLHNKSKRILRQRDLYTVAFDPSLQQQLLPMLLEKLTNLTCPVRAGSCQVTNGFNGASPPLYYKATHPTLNADHIAGSLHRVLLRTRPPPVWKPCLVLAQAMPVALSLYPLPFPTLLFFPQKLGFSSFQSPQIQTTRFCIPNTIATLSSLPPPSLPHTTSSSF